MLGHRLESLRGKKKKECSVKKLEMALRMFQDGTRQSHVFLEALKMFSEEFQKILEVSGVVTQVPKDISRALKCSRNQ